MARKSRRDDALSEVLRWEQAVDRWRSAQSKAEAELASVRSGVGDQVLENPDLAGGISTTIQGLQGEIEVANRAVEAARPKLEAARAAVLEVDAQAFDREAAELRKGLDRHVARTNELLSQLEQHECRFVPEYVWARLMRDSNPQQAPESWSAPKSAELENNVSRAEMRAAVLRDVAAGVDPAKRLKEADSFVDGTVFGLQPSELYPPAVWGPGAVIWAPAYQSKIDHARRVLAHEDAKHAEGIGAEVARFEKKIARVDREDQVLFNQGSPSSSPDAERSEVWRQRVVDLQAEHAAYPERRALLVKDIEALTGERDLDPVEV